VNESSGRDRPVLGYPSGGAPPEERLPKWKVALIVLFFVPPLAYLVLLLLAGD
jgi:hypothetical protein